MATTNSIPMIPVNQQPPMTNEDDNEVISKSDLARRQLVNRYTAVFIPFAIIVLVAYAITTFIAEICIEFLLHPRASLYPSPTPHSRPGIAIVLIILFFILLLPMTVSFFRTIYIANKSPGFVPLGPRYSASSGLQRSFVEEAPRGATCPEFRTKRLWNNGTATADATNGSTDRRVKTNPKNGYYIHPLDVEGIWRGDISIPPGTEQFYSKDIFQCDSMGLPIWCGSCRTWKPDRTHHCSDVGRCVLKLDHFCPWVGGVVSERNIKFFIQFNFYTSLFTLFVLISISIFAAERNRQGATVRSTWLVLIAIAGLFFLFTATMTAKTIGEVFKNLTTIDSFVHRSRRIYLAVKLKNGQTAPVYNPEAKTQNEDDGKWHGTVVYPFLAKGETSQAAVGNRETFAILQTGRGMNPWDLGPRENWNQTMGRKWWDWFLPIRKPPGSHHDQEGNSMYPFGEGLYKLLKDAGINHHSKEMVV